MCAPCRSSQGFYILQHESGRPVVRNDLGRIEEQRTLCVAQEAVGTAERIFLGNAGN